MEKPGHPYRVARKEETLDSLDIIEVADRWARSGVLGVLPTHSDGPYDPLFVHAALGKIVPALLDELRVSRRRHKALQHQVDMLERRLVGKESR